MSIYDVEKRLSHLEAQNIKLLLAVTRAEQRAWDEYNNDAKTNQELDLAAAIHHTIALVLEEMKKAME